MAAPRWHLIAFLNRLKTLFTGGVGTKLPFPHEALRDVPEEPARPAPMDLDEKPAQVRPHQKLGIGINERSKITAEPKAKVKTFRPRQYQGRPELSTFALDDLEDIPAWDLLNAYSNKPPVLGRAELSPADVADAGLYCDPNWVPQRHVNVLGWPDLEEEEIVAAQVLRARHAYFVNPHRPA